MRYVLTSRRLDGNLVPSSRISHHQETDKSMNMTIRSTFSQLTMTTTTIMMGTTSTERVTG